MGLAWLVSGRHSTTADCAARCVMRVCRGHTVCPPYRCPDVQGGGAGRSQTVGYRPQPHSAPRHTPCPASPDGPLTAVQQMAHRACCDGCTVTSGVPLARSLGWVRYAAQVRRSGRVPTWLLPTPEGRPCSRWLRREAWMRCLAGLAWRDPPLDPAGCCVSQLVMMIIVIEYLP